MAPADYSRHQPNVDYLANQMANASVSSQPPRRPRTIAELAEIAKQGTEQDDLRLKQWLREAEKARKVGRLHMEQGDCETAFIHLARAATIVLDKLPNHRDYRTALTPLQRHNMSLHGQEILDQLSTLKQTLLEQSEAYDRLPPNTVAHASSSLGPQQHSPNVGVSPASGSVSSVSTPSSNSHESRSTRRSRSPNVRYEAASAPVAHRASEDRTRNADPRYADAQYSDATARAYYDQPTPQPESVEERRRRREADREAGERYRKEREARVREEEINRRRQQEQDGIMQRQREAEAAQQAVRSAAVSTSKVPPPLAMPTPSNSQISQISMPYLQMPLESPARPQTGIRPSRTPIQPPITTTSPPPSSLGPIQYPSLMSQHQIKQGYKPSASSMFKHAPPLPSSSGLYANPLPRPSVPITAGVRPPPPPPPQQAVVQVPAHQEPEVMSDGLRHVEFPRDCLARFVSIASVNTKRNRETCGLLLGKEQGKRLVVTTLLIPKQHSTSDTCTMDAEELVIQFTEQRTLITLGWIHTHPTQSCFMSSVDLHTHCGFQTMLPESFAVVCAPTSTPNFGIFRLTDPPGLQTILSCQVKEAFHPHPDVPIYTDADKGHVQIRDLPLEIIDLR